MKTKIFSHMKTILFSLFALLSLSIAFCALPSQKQICLNDVSGFNQGVNKLLNDILTTKDVWAIFSDLDSLDEVSYHLQYSCTNYTLDLLAKQSSGQNVTQYQACGQLVGIVGSLLEEKSGPGFRGTTEGGILLSQEALGLSGALSKDCKIILTVDTSEENEDEAEDDENNKEADEDDDDDEEGEKDEDKEVVKRELGSKGKGKKKEEEGKEKEEKHKEKKEKKDKKHKKEKKEEKDESDKEDEKSDDKDEKSDDKDESSDSSDSDSDDVVQKGLSVNLSDEHEGKKDQFIVKYLPSKKGVPQITIQHASEDLAKEESDSSDDSDEPDYNLVNLIQVGKPGDADSGAQWQSGDYNKYMNVSDWQTGGFKRFYEAGITDEENGEDGLPPVISF